MPDKNGPEDETTQFEGHRGENNDTKRRRIVVDDDASGMRWRCRASCTPIPGNQEHTHPGPNV